MAGGPMMNRGMMNGGMVNAGWDGSVSTTTYVDIPELRTVDKYVEVPEVEIKEVVKNVPKYEYVENIVTVPRREVQYVERMVEVPEVHQIVEVPRIEYQEIIRTIPKKEVQTVEKVVEVPEIITTQRMVEVPEIEIQEFVTTVPRVEYQYIQSQQGQQYIQPQTMYTGVTGEPSGFRCNVGCILCVLILGLVAAIIPLAVIRFGNTGGNVYNQDVVTSGTSATLYDCEAGFSNWAQGWSQAKKEYCCKVKECHSIATSESFDCDAAFNNWQAAWSYQKKKFCCATYKKGCMYSEE